MRTLLIINDNSSAAEHAAEFAMAIAQKMQANVLLANVSKVNKTVEKVLVGGIPKKLIMEWHISSLLEHLISINNSQTGFKPEIHDIDISAKNETQLAEFIHKNHIWMIVKGIVDLSSSDLTKRNLNINTILNKVCCPLLLVPESWSIKHLERLVYIADLRYCRLHIVHYLAEMAKHLEADLSIAHLSAKGIPDMEDAYANNVFNKQVRHNVKYNRLYFDDIKEKNLITAVDVIINGMNNDLLVLVNHRFHFKKIVGDYITDILPAHLTIPLLIFPY